MPLGTAGVSAHTARVRARLRHAAHAPAARTEGTTSLGGTWKWRTTFTPVGAGTSTDLTYDYQAPGKLTAVFDRLLIERTVERQFRDATETFRDLAMATVPQPA